MLFILLSILIVFPFVILTASAIGSVLLRTFPTPKERYIWLFISAIPFIGALVYFLLGRRRSVSTSDLTSDE